jgi:hypothetical protein
MESRKEKSEALQLKLKQWQAKKTAIAPVSTPNHSVTTFHLMNQINKILKVRLLFVLILNSRNQILIL